METLQFSFTHIPLQELFLLAKDKQEKTIILPILNFLDNFLDFLYIYFTLNFLSKQPSIPCLGIFHFICRLKMRGICGLQRKKSYLIEGMNLGFGIRDNSLDRKLVYVMNSHEVVSSNLLSFKYYSEMVPKTCHVDCVYNPFKCYVRC